MESVLAECSCMPTAAAGSEPVDEETERRQFLEEIYRDAARHGSAGLFAPGGIVEKFGLKKQRQRPREELRLTVAGYALQQSAVANHVTKGTLQEKGIPDLNTTAEEHVTFVVKQSQELNAQEDDN